MKKFISFLLLLPFLTLHAHNGIQSGYHFTENKGQFDKRVKFHCKLKAGNMFLESDRITFDLYDTKTLDSIINLKNDFQTNPNIDPNNIKPSPVNQQTPSPLLIPRHSYSMIFEGHNPTVGLSTQDKIEGYKNYFKGNDPSKWVTKAESYKSITYNQLYNNIDMEIYSAFEWMKYNFYVKPGGNPNEIKINYNGVNGLSIEDNNLIVKLSTGNVKEAKLVAYQDINGKRERVSCKFKISGNTVSFDFPDGYNENETLVIDPVWVFSSLSGSTVDNWGFTATYDSQGNLCAAGIAFGTGYPTNNGYDATFNGGSFDIALTKFNSTGTNLIYSTYLGGNDTEAPHSLVNDSQGNLVLLASTSSTNFPTTSGAYDQTFNGGTPIYANMWGYVYNNGTDIAVCKFDPTGNLTNSTLIGGTDNEGVNQAMVVNYSDQIRGEVVVDANDNIYVCSSIISTDFPVTNGSTFSGNQDAIVFKMDNTLSNLLWATYLGGTSYDAGYSIREGNGVVYVCGGTLSNDLPSTPGVLHPSIQGAAGDWDGYIASFDATTGNEIALTYIGTSNYDQTFILDLDASNNVYAVGQSIGGYPIYNATYSNPNSAQFIQKLSSDLSTSIYSTVFGSGTANNYINISPTAFLVDNCGNVYVSGWGGGFNNATSSTGAYQPQAGGSVNGMPLTSDAQQSTTDGSDFYFFVMERDAQSLLYGTYFGDNGTAEHTDGGTSRFDPNGIVYQSVCAACNTGNFPTTPGVWAPVSGTAGNPYECNLGVIKFEMNFQGVQAAANVPDSITICSSNYTVSFNATDSSPQHEWNFGDTGVPGGGTSTSANPTYTYSGPGNYTVTYIAIDPASCNLRDTAYFPVHLIDAPTFNASFNLPTIPPCSDPATVSVNASISGTGIDSTQWNMGDGTIYADSTSINYTYTSQGIYPIEVIAWDLTCNFSDTIRDTLNFITAVSTATANGPTDTTICASPPFNMPFTSDGSTPYVYWDFGDGNTSTQQNPTNSYTTSGTYNGYFIAIDSNTCNQRDTLPFTITINQLPAFNASFNLPTIPPCSDPATVSVNASISGTSIDSTQWNMGDGTIYADSTSINYTYTSQGIYPIEVIAWSLACHVSDTIRDTLNFISSISTAVANGPTDTTICASPPFNMPFTSDGSTPYVYWDFGDGNTSTQQNPINSYQNPGTFNGYFVAIDSNTCNQRDTLPFTIIVNQQPSISANFNLPTIPPCSDPATVAVSANIGGVGIDSTLWNMGDGTIYHDSTSINYNYANTGTYNISVTAWDKCGGDTSITQVFVFNIDSSLANANGPTDTTICASPPFVMPFTSDGSTPNVYWDFGDNSGTSSLQNPTYSYSSPGTYNGYFVAIDSSTCNIADTLPFTITINQQPAISASFNLPNIPPCSDPTTVSVSANIGGVGIDSTLWNMGDGTIYYDSTSINYSYSAQGQYTISVTAWDFCGGDTTVQEVFNFFTDSIYAIANGPSDTTLCSSPPYSIPFTSDGSTPSVTWYFGDGDSSNLQNPTHIYADSGSYQVIFIANNPNSCNKTDIDTMLVTLIEAEQFNATVNFTPPPPCEGDSMLVNLTFTGTAADSLVWDMGNGDVFNGNNIAYYYTVPGTYNLVLTAYDFQCDVQKNLNYNVPFYGSSASQVILPNIFTPNGDGSNDYLKFLNIDDTQHYILRIYDRWGVKLLETNDPSDHWDGKTKNGKDVPEGVYYYEIVYTDLCSSEEKATNGFVHVVR